MLFVLIQIWPWLLGALALGAVAGYLARAAAAELVVRSDLPDMRLYALKSAIPTVRSAAVEVAPSAPPEPVEALQDKTLQVELPQVEAIQVEAIQVEALQAEAVQPEPTQGEAIQLEALQVEVLHSELASRDAAIAELRAGLDREVVLRRSAIARLEGLMSELASATATSKTPPDAPR